MVEAAEDIPSTPTRGGGCDQGRPRSTGTTKQPPCSRFVPCLVCRTSCPTALVHAREIPRSWGHHRESVGISTTDVQVSLEAGGRITQVVCLR